MSQVVKRRRTSLLTALVTLLTMLVIPTGGAFAADIGPIDCVSPTLGAAITSAAPGDTIIIADGATCTGNFTVDKELTIRAATATGATLDGASANNGPVLTITGSPVTIQDLTIQNGLNTTPNLGLGGGVLVDGATASIIDSTITLN
ncbi:MAG: hypothetical protein KJO87_02120, partial [Acidimicrobiia bacterium]|nr:hypothetical protein [Acidimicrobiia bacterium]